jgi:cytochrome c-type biogenesis protein
MTADLGLLVAFAGGLLSFLSPCVLPLWPSYVSFLTGMNADEIEQGSPRVRQMQWADKPVGFLGSWLVGLTFGAGWVPCIGPILGAVLTLASVRATLGEGLGLLVAYSAGLAIPFLLTALALGWFLDWFQRFKRYVHWVERVSGALLMAVGLLLVSGKFTLLAGWLANLTPQFLLERI